MALALAESRGSIFEPAKNGVGVASEFGARLKTANAIAMKLGIGKTAMIRVRAGISPRSTLEGAAIPARSQETRHFALA